MYVLGINSAYHELSACLLKNGKIIAAAEEERFNRMKHGKQSSVDQFGLPTHSIHYCLQKASAQEGKVIELKDINHIGNSFEYKARFIKNIQHKHNYAVTRDDFGTFEGESMFRNNNKLVELKLREDGFLGTLHYLNHHDCHAASAFFVAPFKEAAILVIDGIGEYETTTIYNGNGSKIEKIIAWDYPNSIGFLWEKICKYLGFSEYDACKLMGLASYGNAAKYEKEFKDFINYNEDGFSIDDNFVKFRVEDYANFENLFDQKKIESEIQDVGSDNIKCADIAATLQKITEEIVVLLAQRAKYETGSSNLCLAGGVSLNCCVNSKLAESKVFDEIFIQPAANDAGTALGAAFCISNQIEEKSRNCRYFDPYLGPSFSDDEIIQEIEKRGLNYKKQNFIEKYTAKLIADGSIVAWFQGKMEWGPRALGNRSILADPRKKEMVDVLNKKTKFREPFRPFCPSILKEKACDWYQLDSSLTHASKYMLATCKVLPNQRDHIPAVVHIDGTSRIQVVEKDFNPRYYKLLAEFEILTNIPILLNTSFNVQEPIVCSPSDAINTFLKTDIDYLVLGDFVISKHSNQISLDVRDIKIAKYFELLR